MIIEELYIMMVIRPQGPAAVLYCNCVPVLVFLFLFQLYYYVEAGNKSLVCCLGLFIFISQQCGSLAFGPSWIHSSACKVAS